MSAAVNAEVNSLAKEGATIQDFEASTDLTFLEAEASATIAEIEQAITTPTSFPDNIAHRRPGAGAELLGQVRLLLRRLHRDLDAAAHRLLRDEEARQAGEGVPAQLVREAQRSARLVPQGRGEGGARRDRRPRGTAREHRASGSRRLRIRRYALGGRLMRRPSNTQLHNIRI